MRRYQFPPWFCSALPIKLKCSDTTVSQLDHSFWALCSKYLSNYVFMQTGSPRNVDVITREVQLLPVYQERIVLYGSGYLPHLCVRALRAFSVLPHPFTILQILLMVNLSYVNILAVRP